MNKRKIIAVLLSVMVVVGLFASCGNQDATKGKKKLVMATGPTFAPYSYLDGSGPVGIDIDIANEIAKDMDCELEIITMDFTAVIPSVKSGKADFAASGISVTEERKKEVDFTIPYATSVQVILTTPKADIHNVNDLKGKKVGVQLGTTSDLQMQQDYPEIDLVQGKKYADLILDLSNGKIDAIVLDDLPAKAIQEENPHFVIAEESFYSDAYAFAVDKGDTETLDALNKTLERLIAEGKIDEYMANHTK